MVELADRDVCAVIEAERKAATAAERERCANVSVRCEKFGTASNDYLEGFAAGAVAVLDAIRNSP